MMLGYNTAKLSYVSLFLFVLSTIGGNTVSQSLGDAPTMKKKENWENNAIMEGKSEKEFQRIRDVRQMILNNGCDTNLCFVIDGSSSISAEDFENQKNFIDLIIAITTTDSGGNFCGVITSDVFTSISPLTGDKEKFLRKLRALKYSKSFSNNNLIPGLGVSIKHLRKQRQDANNVLFFAKEKPIVPTVPIWFKNFIRRGDAISAVVLDTNIADDLIKITGDINRILPIDGFFEISEIIVAVVADVCSTRCTTMTFSPKRRKIMNSHDEIFPFVRCPLRLGNTRRFRKYSKKSPFPDFGTGTSSEAASVETNKKSQVGA